MSKAKIALLLSYICVASLSAAIITPALPQLQHSLHLSHGSLEWIISIFLAGYVIGQLIYGPLANRYNPLNALRGGLCLNLIGILLCIMANHLGSFYGLLFGRLLTALGAASGLACTFMLIHELLDEQQTKHVLAYTIVAFTVGIGLAVTLGGIITQYGQWQWCFYVLLAHGMLMLAGTWLFPTPQHQAKPIKIMTLLHDYKLALQSKTLITYSLVIGFCSAFGYCYAAAAPLITHYLFHLSPSHYGYWNLLNMLGMFCSGFLTHRALKRFEPRQVIWFALIASGLCLLSLIALAYDIQAANVAWFFATTCALYLFTGMLFPCASFYASRAIACKASAASMMSFINMGSAMLAVIIMGYLPLSSLTGFITMMTVFLIIGLACLLLIK